ncbi:MAG: hypothetical protein IJ730_03380 [Alphaproteobacteria bacterium]|nr:hypothetical protein [Alphaproteobacteria bacterium]
MKRFLAVCILFLPFVEGSDGDGALASRILSSISFSSQEPLHIVTLTRQQSGKMAGGNGVLIARLRQLKRAHYLLLQICFWEKKTKVVF